MLKYAKIYEEKLNEMYHEIILDEKYKFFANSCWWENEIELSEDTWDSLDFVSIDAEENVIGFMRADISRGNEKINNLEIINFSQKGNSTFSRD